MENEYKETIKILKEKKEKLIKQIADINISKETANSLLSQIYDLDKKLEEYYIKLEKSKYNIYTYKYYFIYIFKKMNSSMIRKTKKKKKY